MGKPVLGTLGGVGPLATALLMRMVIEKTPARIDHEHIPMIVFNDPQIPDRTAPILDRSKPDPLPEMAKVARWLQEARADFIAIARNTAHFYYDGIAASVSIPVLNIMEETAREAAVRRAASALPPLRCGGGGLLPRKGGRIGAASVRVCVVVVHAPARADG